MSVAVNPDRLEAVDPLAATNPAQNVGFLMLQLGRDELGNGLTHHLSGAVAEQALRALIPGGDDAIEIFADDAVLRGLNNSRQAGTRLHEIALGLQPVFWLSHSDYVTLSPPWSAETITPPDSSGERARR